MWRSQVTTETLTFNRKNDVPYFQFEHLVAFQNIQHAIFTRRGGLSASPYQSLNIGFGEKDDPRAVLENRHLIGRCFEDARMVYIDQMHSTEVVVLPADEAAKTHTGPLPLLRGDALITNRPNLVLVVQVADCQSIILYDPAQQVIANVHCGWRGSIHNMVQQTIRAMVDRFGTRPPRLRAGIGPSLGPCCAEFVNYQDEIPSHMWKYKNDSNHFDFRAISYDQLCAEGLDPQNIIVADLCTRCHPSLFFSYRGEGVTGRFAVAIGLRSFA